MLSKQTLSPFFVFYGTATLFLEIISGSEIALSWLPMRLKILQVLATRISQLVASGRLYDGPEGSQFSCDFPQFSCDFHTVQL